MELLVVISIIMMLMGMLFAGIRMAKDSAARAKTLDKITQLKASCESYRSVNGRYPEATPLLEAQFGAGPTYDTFDTLGSAKWISINEALVSALNSAGESFHAPEVDAWKVAIRYRPARYYPYKPAGTGIAVIDSDEPPAHDSIQLWSTGKDKIDQGGELNSDDVTSWK